MKRTATLLLMTWTFLSVKSQTLPDKINIVQNTYAYSAFIDTVELYDSDTIVLTDKRKISKLFAELEKYDNEELLLEKFEIDTAFIQNNPDYVLSLYNGKMKIDWNKEQKKYILRELNDINVCKDLINKYISNYTSKKKIHLFPITRLRNFRLSGICVMGRPTYRTEYVISIYNNNIITNIFTSKRRTSGYYFPYHDQLDRVVYNYRIDKELNNIFNREIRINKPLHGRDLLKYIVNQIVNDNMRELYKLSAYSYENEIWELSTDFNIISSEEVYGRGRYIGDEPKTMKITLKNNYMLPNVYLQFLDSKYGNTLYSRDSIKKDYKEIVSRVQAIPFITNYLQQDTSSRLDIYYFNNCGINKDNIDKVNKNPTEWKKQDEYIESLKWYEKKNIMPCFDIADAIKTSEIVHCGCNYRFENNFIKKAIFIEITSNKNASSIWFLLPDDTMLLYHVDSYQLDDTKVLDIDLNRLLNSMKLPFACLRFDKYGNLIEKK